MAYEKGHIFPISYTASSVWIEYAAHPFGKVSRIGSLRGPMAEKLGPGHR